MCLFNVNLKLIPNLLLIKVIQEKPLESINSVGSFITYDLLSGGSHVYQPDSKFYKSEGLTVETD